MYEATQNDLYLTDLVVEGEHRLDDEVGRKARVQNQSPSFYRNTLNHMILILNCS